MAALMPPAAATEWERTGWTLLMMATLAPASAAASAARWPARPAPRIRTSCAGMALLPGQVRKGPWTLLSRPLQPRSDRAGGQRAADAVERHDATQAVVGVDDDQGPEPPQRLRPQQVLQRRVARDARAGARGLGEIGRGQGGPALGDGAVDPLLDEESAHVAQRVDHREPRLLVAQEELVLGVQRRRGAGHRDRLGVHEVGRGDALDPPGELARD